MTAVMQRRGGFREPSPHQLSVRQDRERQALGLASHGRMPQYRLCRRNRSPVSSFRDLGVCCGSHLSALKQFLSGNWHGCLTGPLIGGAGGVSAVTEWLIATIPLWKALHLLALTIWCGGLVALPMMLSLHDPAVSQADYTHIRRSTHLVYTIVVTPAAVIAVIAGTWLIFLREAFVPWLFAKLAFVSLLLVLHAWIGHNIVRIAEEPGTHTPPNPYAPAAGVLACAMAILVMVLAKPELAWIDFPDWLTNPRGGQLPFAVPSR